MLIETFLTLLFLGFAKNYESGTSQSMLPTVAPDSIVACSKLVSIPPHRGDIVAFRYPPNIEVTHLKRVIGLPGEKIQLKRGVVHINGNPLAADIDGPYGVQLLSEGTATVITETLADGRSYQTLNLTDQGIGDDTSEWLVPAGHFFVLGDNRDNANDSRSAVGFVPFGNIVATCGS
jgi:signal peptidase I